MATIFLGVVRAQLGKLFAISPKSQEATRR